MDTILYSMLSSANTIVPIVLTIVLGTLAILGFTGKSFKDTLLSEHRDGMRLMIFGLGMIVVAVIVPNSTNLVLLGTFGTIFFVLGLSIAVADKLTIALLKWRWIWMALTIGVFIWKAFVGYPFAGFNLSATLTVKVLVVTFFLTGAVLSFLSEDMKSRLLPANSDGVRLLVYGAVALVLSGLSANPIYMVACATFAAFGVMFGLLIALPDSLTKSLLTKAPGIIMLIVGGILFMF